MINSHTVDSHHVLCDLTTSSRVGFTQDDRKDPVLSNEAPLDKPSEEGITCKPNRTNEIINLQTEFSLVRKTPSINTLPNNLLHLIFSYLDIRERFKTEMVCKQWRLIGKLLPWTNPVKLTFAEDAAVSSLGIPSAGLTDNILLSLLMRCGSCLVKLKLSFDCNDTMPLSYKTIANVGRYCPKLEVFTLCVPAIENDALKIIAFACRKLRKFHVGYFSNNESEEGILAIVRKCVALESITISGLNRTEKLFDVTGSRISEIWIFTCKLEDKAPQNSTACSQINFRKLNMCFFSNHLMGADESTWFAVIDRFKVSLQSLNTFQVEMQTNLNWCEGLKNLHNLVELTLRFYPSINDDLIAVIVNQCPELRTLELPGSNITDSGVAALNSLPHLTRLDISHNRNVSARGLTDLILRDALEVLYVACAPRITEEFCCSLAKKCPNLEKLDVSGSKHMTKRLVAAFRDAFEAGLRQKPVKLIVARTSVKGKVKRCKGMEIDFNYPWKIPTMQNTLLRFF